MVQVSLLLKILVGKRPASGEINKKKIFLCHPGQDSPSLKIPFIVKCFVFDDVGAETLRQMELEMGERSLVKI